MKTRSIRWSSFVALLAVFGGCVGDPEYGRREDSLTASAAVELRSLDREGLVRLALDLESEDCELLAEQADREGHSIRWWVSLGLVPNAFLEIDGVLGCSTNADGIAATKWEIGSAPRLTKAGPGIHYNGPKPEPAAGGEDQNGPKPEPATGEDENGPKPEPATGSSWPGPRTTGTTSTPESISDGTSSR